MHVHSVYGVLWLTKDIPDSDYGAEGLRDIYLRLQAIQRPELCVRGMAFSFNTEIGRRFGFRTDIIRGEDGSLALAMKPYGKIVFITSRKARVLTSNGTLNSEGSLIDNIWIRVIKALKEITGLFIKRRHTKIKTLISSNKVSSKSLWIWQNI